MPTRGAAPGSCSPDPICDYPSDEAVRLAALLAQGAIAVAAAKLSRAGQSDPSRVGETDPAFGAGVVGLIGRCGVTTAGRRIGSG